MVGKTRRAYAWVTRIALLVCELGVVVMAGYSFADVSGRFLFHRPLGGTIEICGLLMVAVVFLSLASCQAEGRHMRVDFLFPWMSKRVRAVADSIACVCGIMVCGLVAWCSIIPAWYSWTIGEVSMGLIAFPVYPAKFLVVVGAVLLGVQLLLDLVATLSKGFGARAVASKTESS
jgi:TRAP-type C4-dicarboxylate transport system permease small subunit